MDDASLVGCFHSLSDLHGYLASFFYRNRAASDPLRQSLTRHELEHEIVRALGLLEPAVVFYIESRRFLIRDSPRPATTYEQKTGGADGVKGA